MYKHWQIEKKWQKFWDQHKTFQTTNKYLQKFYVLDMFPYPSGAGLHVGHLKGYIASDVIARYKRLKQFDVLHPIGWDAFGLPAEQYALKTGNHPQSFTIKNINNFRKQLKMLAFSYDYDKEINTTDPNYYQQTQWIFVQMYKQNLVEKHEIEANWCQELGTVLANEEVISSKDGSLRSERGNFLVTKRKMSQWVLKITNYAEKLLKGLEEVDWPESLKKLQRNWIGKKTINGKVSYKLRDWVFARQRYWGEPFPLAFDENNNILLIEELVKLPKMNKITPAGTGESPLANNQKWLYFYKNGKKYRRDTNTMPQWAGSSWYYLAYILKNTNNSYLKLNSKLAWKRFQKWLPIDLYIGGQEHAVMHLLYARFWHKVLYDLKIVPTSEPFKKIINQGMILSADGSKMSKSKGNVITPNEIIKKFGVDSLRVYQMFMGPITKKKVWDSQTISSINKWLNKIYQTTKWDLVKTTKSSHFHQLVKNFSNNIEACKFNLAISNLMVYHNFITKKKIWNQDELIGFMIMLSLFAPHLAEEVLAQMGTKPIHLQIWPKYAPSKLLKTKTILAIQINGKLKATLNLRKQINKEQIIALAKQNTNVKKNLDKQTIIKVIYVAKKIVNFVTKT